MIVLLQQQHGQSWKGLCRVQAAEFGRFGFAPRHARTVATAWSLATGLLSLAAFSFALRNGLMSGAVGFVACVPFAAYAALAFVPRWGGPARRVIEASFLERLGFGAVSGVIGWGVTCLVLMGVGEYHGAWTFVLMAGLLAFAFLALWASWRVAFEACCE